MMIFDLTVPPKLKLKEKKRPQQESNLFLFLYLCIFVFRTYTIDGQCHFSIDSQTKCIRSATGIQEKSNSSLKIETTLVLNIKKH